MQKITAVAENHGVCDFIFEPSEFNARLCNEPVIFT
jgi:hypothetical protein